MTNWAHIPTKELELILSLLQEKRETDCEDVGYEFVKTMIYEIDIELEERKN